MLAVDRQEPHALCLRKRSDLLTRHHHHFLGRKRNVHPLLDRRDRRSDTAHPDRRDQTDVRLVLFDRLHRGILTHVRPRAEGLRKRLALVLRPERRNRDDLKIVWMREHHIDRATSDRPRCSQYNQTLHR